MREYTIIYEKPAVKFLRQQPPAQQKRLIEAIHKLPFDGDIKPMVNHSGEYRLRVGSYRVIYTLENRTLIIRIMTIGNRGDVYK